MVRVVLSLCLIGAVVCPSVARHVVSAPPRYVQPQHPVALKSQPGNEVHSVVVDMPHVGSLEFASPDTWYRLPKESLPD
jgi:hypothetical protein